MERKVTLKIERLGNHFERASQFGDSYFRDEYEQAFYAAKDIIKQTEVILENKGKVEDYKYQEMDNIISFVGGRGTGKTSAMLSFMAGLRYYNDRSYNREENKFYGYFEKGLPEPVSGRYYPQRNLNFICLDCIDGSLLEEDEDIFRVVLAQMYNKFLDFDTHMVLKDGDYEDRKQRVQKAFDRLYRNICQIESKESNSSIWEESPITSLRNLSNSMKLRQEFGKLVGEYLDALQEGNMGAARGCRQFLVIVIDDLDLNVEHGCDMLEKIHRYMMTPQVIVLMSFDYRQLKKLCFKRFFDMIPKVDSIMMDRKGDAERLAEEYLDKVLPSSKRVYMPIFRRLKHVRLQVGDTSYTVKKGIFRCLYRCTGIRFDTEGMKYHFYEPDSLRELANLYLLIDGMEALDCSGAGNPPQEVYDANHDRIFYDILHRIAGKSLTDDYEKYFLSLTRQSVERSLRAFVGLAGKKLDQIRKENREKDRDTDSSSVQKLKTCLAEAERYGYSYGEILRLVYCWGRVDDESKSFIRSVLAYYSLELTRTFFNYRYHSDNKEKERAKGCLREVLNGSFSGSWSNKMLPPLERTHLVGAVRDIRMSDMELVLESNLLTRKDSMLLQGLNNRYRTEIQKIIRTVITWAMFFSRPYYKERPADLWRFKTRRTSRASSLLTTDQGDELMKPYVTGVTVLRFDDNQADFNIFNFVVNVFDYKDCVERIQASLLDQLFLELPFAVKVTRKELLDDVSVMGEFNGWSKEYGDLVLPVYDIDLCYNLMKRVRRKMYYESLDSHKAEKLVSYFYEILLDIGSQLKKNDDFYGAEETERLQSAYMSCPIVQWLTDALGERRKKYLLPNFDRHLADVFRGVSSGANVETDSEESLERLRIGDE